MLSTFLNRNTTFFQSTAIVAGPVVADESVLIKKKRIKLERGDQTIRNISSMYAQNWFAIWISDVCVA